MLSCAFLEAGNLRQPFGFFDNYSRSPWPGGHPEETSSMYKTIYVPVDNSDHSNTAVDIGVHFAKAFGSKIVGSHVYAAKMHDKRFKQMEAGLPEEYHDENELERQRQIHDSLITRGLQIITDSYLDIVDKKTAEANIPVERRSLEGRNFKVLVEDINTNAYDLVIM